MHSRFRGNDEHLGAIYRAPTLNPYLHQSAMVLPLRRGKVRFPALCPDKGTMDALL